MRVYLFHGSINYCPAALTKMDTNFTNVSIVVVGASKFNEHDRFVVQVHYLNDLVHLKLLPSIHQPQCLAPFFMIISWAECVNFPDFSIKICIFNDIYFKKFIFHATNQNNLKK